MSYDVNLWDRYTSDNETMLNDKLSEFIYHVTLALGAKKVLEVGCNVGNNLRAFPSTFDITGIDLNEYALNKARKNLPTFNFKKGSILEIPFDDSTLDLVFTRGVLIHIRAENMKKAMSELFRVSKRWIFNVEYFGEGEKEINWKRGRDSLWYRNMQKRWSDFDVDIISDVDIPLEVDSANSRFTLVKKILN
jgi:SAM-dependent methyltransferase